MNTFVEDSTIPIVVGDADVSIGAMAVSRSPNMGTLAMMRPSVVVVVVAMLSPSF